MIQDTRGIVELLLKGKKILVICPTLTDCNIVKHHVATVLEMMNKNIEVTAGSIYVINLGAVYFSANTLFGLRGLQADAIYLDEVFLTKGNVQEFGLVLR